MVVLTIAVWTIGLILMVTGWASGTAGIFAATSAPQQAAAAATTAVSIVAPYCICRAVSELLAAFRSRKG